MGDNDLISTPWDFEDEIEFQGPTQQPLPQPIEGPASRISRTRVENVSRGREPAPGISLPQESPTNQFGDPISTPASPAEEAIAESDAIDAMAGPAAELQSSEPEADQPNDPQRGLPIENRAELRQQWRRAGGERIRVLTDAFGDDATMIGHLLFDVPPLGIRVNRGSGTYRWKPLRTKESIAVKSGNGECFIEIDLAFVGLNQIRNSLASLVSLWKKAPITFFENAFVRNEVIPDAQEDSMAVCLETLVLDVVAGKPNTVWATLMLRWFNYKPYTSNFWYREEWRTSAAGRSTSSGNGESPVPVPTIDRVNSIIDLSAMDSVDTMALSQPVEAKLDYHELSDNPGDPLVEATSPVVYPFNSEPFVDYINNGIDSAVRVSSWSDNLVMKWNSFVRYQIPRSWQYSVNQPTEVSIAAETTRDRTDTAQPTPVEGDRTAILFMGDSIMVGFLGLAGRDENGLPGSPPWSQANWVEGVNETFFPSKQGFDYYCSCRTSMGSARMADWWDIIKSRDELKKPGGSDLSNLAGIVIHMGSNDGLNGPRTDDIGRVMREASEAGAIPVLLPLPPSNDDLEYTVSTHVQKSWWRRSHPERPHPAVDSYFQNIDTYHTQMVQLANGINNSVGPDQIDYHAVATNPERRTGRHSPLNRSWMNTNSPVPGVYNIHWNGAGRRTGGQWIYDHLPWSALSGETAPDGLWHVCNINDGDTIRVWRVNPGSEDREARTIRLQFIDTPESYSRFNDMINAPFYSGTDLNRWLPEGQDSWRPAAKKLADLAKSALQTLIGGGDPGLAIDFDGTGEYGRWLGVLHKGDQNLNLEMVRMGHAYHMVGDNPGTQREYLAAETEARAGGRGIWAPKYAPLSGEPTDLPDDIRQDLESGMLPVDWRSTYPAGSTGGYVDPTAPCPPTS